MSKKSLRDYFNVAQLGPDHVDDNPGISWMHVWGDINKNCTSLRSMAVLSSRAHERRSREKNKNQFQLLPPQSPRGFSPVARLYFLATKTAMLRRLELDGKFTPREKM